MGWRLFESLEQSVKTMIREHMHLIDEVHLESTSARQVLHILEQLAHFLNFRA